MNNAKWIAIGTGAVAVLFFQSFLLTLIGLAVFAGGVYAITSNRGNMPMIDYQNLNKLNNIRKQIGR